MEGLMGEVRREEDELEMAPEEKRRDKPLIAFLKRNSSTLMISAAVHAVILLIIGLFNVTVQTSKVIEVVISTPPPFEKQKIEDPVKMDQVDPTEVEPVLVDEVVEVDPVEVAFEEVLVEIVSDSSFDLAEVSEESMQTDALMSSLIGVPVLVGVGESFPDGVGKEGPLGKELVHRRKNPPGDPEMEDSRDQALDWLAYHQEEDGSWDATKYEGSHTGRFATTGTALLAFLGAGHSEQAGPYKETMKKGVAWLNKKVSAISDKKEDFVQGRCYGTSIAMMALAEAHTFGSYSPTGENADFLAQEFIDSYYKAGAKKNPEKVAWRYNGGTDRPDQSVSSWIALGLKSVKIAGLPSMSGEKGNEIFYLYEQWVRTMTDEITGKGRYSPNSMPNSSSMMVVGMFQRQFLHFPRNDAYLKKAGQNLLGGEIERLLGGKPDLAYNIYYGSLAAFQSQGDVWAMWKDKMKKCLIAEQRKGNPKEFGGSWNPAGDKIGSHGGRVMTTALYALCMEVAYRHALMTDPRTDG